MWCGPNCSRRRGPSSRGCGLQPAPKSLSSPSNNVPTGNSILLPAAPGPALISWMNVSASYPPLPRSPISMHHCPSGLNPLPVVKRLRFAKYALTCPLRLGHRLPPDLTWVCRWSWSIRAVRAATGLCITRFPTLIFMHRRVLP